MYIGKEKWIFTHVNSRMSAKLTDKKPLFSKVQYNLPGSVNSSISRNMAFNIPIFVFLLFLSSYVTTRICNSIITWLPIIIIQHFSTSDDVSFPR